MHIIDKLLNNAYQDTQLLITNDEHGDDLSIPRDVDFILYAPDLKKAEVIADFVNDNQYGQASFEEINENCRVTVVINMPITQNIICSVSGLMQCIAELFNSEYDGWSSDLQRTRE